MHKILLATFCLNPVILFSNVAVQQQINSTSIASSWEPDYLRENLVIDSDQQFTGTMENHAKGQMQINRSDFKFKETSKSFQITNFEFRFSAEIKRVFQTSYTDASYTLNNDQLVQATNHISKNKPLFLWVEGWNNFFEFHIKSGISQIKSAYIDKNVGAFAVRYKIYNFSARISYKYLINSQDENVSEQNIRNFFKKEHDFDLTNFNNGNDVLENLKAELKKIVANPTIANELRVDLPYRDNSRNNSKNNEEWTVNVSLYNGSISPQNGKKYFTLKLINISLYSEDVVNIYQYLGSIHWSIRRPFKYASYTKKERMLNTVPIFAETLKENYRWKNQTKPVEYFIQASKKYLSIRNSLFQKNNTFYIEISVKSDNRPLGQLAIKEFN